jgi:hypothetical protein
VATTVGLAPDVAYTLGADSVALDIDTLGLEISWTETHHCLFVTKTPDSTRRANNWAVGLPTGKRGQLRLERLTDPSVWACPAGDRPARFTSLGHAAGHLPRGRTGPGRVREAPAWGAARGSLPAAGGHAHTGLGPGLSGFAVSRAWRRHRCHGIVHAHRPARTRRHNRPRGSPSNHERAAGVVNPPWRRPYREHHDVVLHLPQ